MDSLGTPQELGERFIAYTLETGVTDDDVQGALRGLTLLLADRDATIARLEAVRAAGDAMAMQFEDCWDDEVIFPERPKTLVAYRAATASLDAAAREGA